MVGRAGLSRPASTHLPGLARSPGVYAGNEKVSSVDTRPHYPRQIFSYAAW
jgi:hypothetical protein